jgi:hypothetical protein
MSAIVDAHRTWDNEDFLIARAPDLEAFLACPWPCRNLAWFNSTWLGDYRAVMALYQHRNTLFITMDRHLIRKFGRAGVGPPFTPQLAWRRRNAYYSWNATLPTGLWQPMPAGTIYPHGNAPPPITNPGWRAWYRGMRRGGEVRVGYFDYYLNNSRMMELFGDIEEPSTLTPPGPRLAIPSLTPMRDLRIVLEDPWLRRRGGTIEGGPTYLGPFQSRGARFCDSLIQVFSALLGRHLGALPVTLFGVPPAAPPSTIQYLKVCLKLKSPGEARSIVQPGPGPSPILDDIRQYFERYFMGDGFPVGVGMVVSRATTVFAALNQVDFDIMGDGIRRSWTYTPQPPPAMRNDAPWVRTVRA